MPDGLVIESLDGWAPVQSWGSIDGDEYYFRSRGNDWDFAVSDDPSIDPTDGIIARLAFYREGQYGDGPFGASYMPLHLAEFIIRWCSRDYLIESQLSARSPSP